MILSPSSSSSAGGAVTGGGVTGLGLVSGGTLVGLFWGVGGGVSSSCRREDVKDELKENISTCCLDKCWEKSPTRRRLHPDPPSILE